MRRPLLPVERCWLWNLSDQGKRINAFELFCAYWAVADEYDRAICTGPIYDGCISAADRDEALASSRYHRDLHDEIEAIAADMGIGEEDLILGTMEADDLRQRHCQTHGERSGWSQVLRQRMHAKAVHAARERVKRGRRIAASA